MPAYIKNILLLRFFVFRLLQDSASIRYYSTPRYIMGSRIRYQGSLTQPPCTENVIWTVYPRPITLSHTQVRCHRNLLFRKTFS